MLRTLLCGVANFFQFGRPFPEWVLVFRAFVQGSVVCHQAWQTLIWPTLAFQKGWSLRCISFRALTGHFCRPFADSGDTLLSPCHQRLLFFEKEGTKMWSELEREL
eukprot:Lithocolla_globosa_v1_NODE_2137_length_2147_cov_5.664914.p2 type:complete len:106 gc:universal NODE_2137_length_2147_cov_5.664914:597-914(+)